MYSLSLTRLLFLSVFVIISKESVVTQSAATPQLIEEEARRRVYNGEDDIYNMYPFVVALGVTGPQLLSIYRERFPSAVIPVIKDPKFVRTCSGSLITDQWVLSAGHCMGAPLMRYGNMTAAAYSKVLKSINHPRFSLNRTKDYTEGANDIGLLLVSKVQLKTYGQLSTINHKALLGLTLNYVGYGVTEIPPVSYYDQLKFAFEHNTKKRKIGQGVAISCDEDIKTICIAPCSIRPNAGLAGDSGGPVFYAGRIVGVFNTWIADGNLNTAAAVELYLNWISQVISSC